MARGERESGLGSRRMNVTAGKASLPELPGCDFASIE
jgi:hypothetical protein